MPCVPKQKKWVPGTCLWNSVIALQISGNGYMVDDLIHSQAVREGIINPQGAFTGQRMWAPT